MCSDVTCKYIRQIKVKVESICPNVSYLAPKPSVHTVICVLGSGGIMGDVRLFGLKQYMLGANFLQDNVRKFGFGFGIFFTCFKHWLLSKDEQDFKKGKTVCNLQVCYW